MSEMWINTSHLQDRIEDIYRNMKHLAKRKGALLRTKIAYDEVCIARAEIEQVREDMNSLMEIVLKVGDG
jgi:hypothetical protein